MYGTKDSIRKIELHFGYYNAVIKRFENSEILEGQ